MYYVVTVSGPLHDGLLHGQPDTASILCGSWLRGQGLVITPAYINQCGALWGICGDIIMWKGESLEKSATSGHLGYLLSLGILYYTYKATALCACCCFRLRKFIF